MEIQGEKFLAVPRGDVWCALNDPAVLQRCVPGCDSFEAEGENKYRIAMQAVVGPVRARFAGTLLLRDVIAPTSYALAFEGSGGVAGFGKGTAQVVLEDAVEGTRLRYAAQAQVGGRLAQVGARLIDGVTKRMADEFFSRFVRELTTRHGSEHDVGDQPVKAASPSLLGVPTQVLVQAPPALPGQFPTKGSLIAVIAASVSATAAAVAVLAAVVATLAVR